MERAGRVETVTGYDDLPLPAGALVNNQTRFYDATYRGEPVRIAAMAAAGSTGPTRASA